MSNDTVLGFLNEKDLFIYIYNKDVRTPEMWSMYRSYCTNNGLCPIKKHEFYNNLIQLYSFTKKVINGYDYLFKYKSLNS